MPSVTLESLGGASKYSIVFGGPVESSSNLEFNDTVGVQGVENIVAGEVVDGIDVATGPYPVEIRNPDNVIFGSPPTIRADVDGRTRLIEPGGSVTLADISDEGGEEDMACASATIPTDESDGENDGDGPIGGGGDGDYQIPFGVDRQTALIGAGVIGAGYVWAKSRSGR